MIRGRLEFGPEVGTFAPQPMIADESAAAAVRPNVSVSLAGTEVQPGRVAVSYALSPGDQDPNSTLRAIIVAALPLGVDRPATPQEVLDHPEAVIAEADLATSPTSADGRVVVDLIGGVPGKSYAAVTVLEFDRPDAAATTADQAVPVAAG